MVDFKKVLIIRTGAIGDVIHTTNTFRAIKEAHPEVEIHYLTSIDTKLLEFDKNISKVWAIKDKQLKVFSKYMKEWTQILKAENFDAVINLQPSVKLRMLATMAGIKHQFNYEKNLASCMHCLCPSGKPSLHQLCEPEKTCLFPGGRLTLCQCAEHCTTI